MSSVQQQQRSIDLFLSKILLMRYWPSWITPNSLSYVRVVILAPLVLYCLFFGLITAACLAFLLAGLLDALDGTLARLRNATSPYGAFLDALSDKLLNVPIMFFLAWGCGAFGIAMGVVVLILFFAIALTLVRIFKTRGSIDTMPVRMISASSSGKIKMRLEVTGITLSMIGLIIPSLMLRIFVLHLGAICIIASLPFAVLSFYDQLRK
jgi:phosphatidylglycerophosphate synthase